MKVRRAFFLYEKTQFLVLDILRYADGINLHTGISNVVIEQSMLRNLGDDGLAVGFGTTDSTGTVIVPYTVPKNASLGLHGIFVRYNPDTTYIGSTGSANLTVH